MADILETGDRDDGGEMASSGEYLEYVLDLLSEVDGIECWKMMGEYVLYCRGKVIGGIYDDRFLIKPTASARRMLPDARMEFPYEGAKEMLLVDTEDRRRVAEAVEAMWAELPEPGRKTP